MPGPNNVALDINKFAVKYNFKIAEKIFTEAQTENVLPPSDFVKRQFKRNAIVEIIEECSK